MERERERGELVMERGKEEDVCSICYNTFSLPCRANCSHCFCAACILRVWNYASDLKPCPCPLCRQKISLLVPSVVSPEQFCHFDVAEIDRYNLVAAREALKDEMLQCSYRMFRKLKNQAMMDYFEQGFQAIGMVPQLTPTLLPDELYNPMYTNKAMENLIARIFPRTYYEGETVYRYKDPMSRYATEEDSQPSG